MLFDDITTKEEREQGFIPVEELFRRCMESSVYTHQGNGGGIVECSVSVARVRYELEFWHQRGSIEECGIFWNVGAANSRGIVNCSEGNFVKGFVPLNAEAVVASISVAFDLDAAHVAKNAVNLRRYWDAEDIDDYSLPPARLAKRYRLLGAC